MSLFNPPQPEPSWQERYDAVIRSARWKAIKRRLIKERGGLCQRCRCAEKLQLHHKTYERLGRERDDDLELVCADCHKLADDERAERGKKKSADALYDAQLDGWATKKYGEEWAQDRDEGEVAESFDRWLEDHE